MRFVFILLLLFPLCLAAAEPEGVTAPSYLLVEMDNLPDHRGEGLSQKTPACEYHKSHDNTPCY